MKKLILIFSLLVFTLLTYAQSVDVNIGVNISNNDKLEVFNVWKNYLKSKTSSLRKTYWNSYDVANYQSFDFLKSEGYIQPSIYDLDLDVLVLKIVKKNGVYKIQSQFYWNDKPLKVFAITNVYCKKVNGEYKLFNNLSTVTERWVTKKVGNINYHYDGAYSFNQQNGEKANAFYSKLIDEFDLDNIEINYFIFDSCEELESAKGFGYVIGDSPKGCGFFDKENYFIYSSQGEYHLHEIVHVINNKFLKAHSVFLAGISALWGGHFGKEIEAHYSSFIHDVKENDINLEEILDYTYIDESTSPIYIYGALFCKEAIDKGGIKKLEKLFSYGRSKNDFYIALEKELGLSKKDIPDFILSRINQ